MPELFLDFRLLSELEQPSILNVKRFYLEREREIYRRVAEWEVKRSTPTPSFQNCPTPTFPNF